MTRSRSRALSLAFALAGCTSTLAAPATVHPAATVHATARAAVDANDVHAFASASNELGLDVWEALRADHGSTNLAISPASIATALAMTYGGARGATATAMASTMHVSSSPDETMAAAGRLVGHWNDASRTSYELAVANRLFGARDYPFADAYLAATRDEMGAELQRLDFGASGAVDTINGWVSDRTHARIAALLPPDAVDASTRLVLVNAVYFHGAWAHPFRRDRTTDRTFHAPAGDHVVPTMSREGADYGEDDGVQLLQLPYAGHELSMLFVLPRDRDGLATIESRLDDALVQRWASRLQRDEETEVLLPRFRIETSSMSLTQALSALGMSVAFSRTADFSGMSAPGAAQLELDEVFHRVFVELNEEGTEASAATGAMITLTSERIPHPPPRFEADHPFLFFLREPSTGAILFAGRVVDPG